MIIDPCPRLTKDTSMQIENMSEEEAGGCVSFALIGWPEAMILEHDPT